MLGVKILEKAFVDDDGGNEYVTDIGRWMEKKEAIWISIGSI